MAFCVQVPPSTSVKIIVDILISFDIMELKIEYVLFFDN